MVRLRGFVVNSGSSWMYGFDPASCTVVKYSHLWKRVNLIDIALGKLQKGK